MNVRHFAAAAALAGAIAAGVVVSAENDAVPYPDGYRAWQHVKSMVIGEGHPLYGSFGGIHHLYANEQAMAGYTGGHFADGAVIVFDLLDVVAADGAIAEGKRKVVGVMHRDAKKYASTGGWGFEGFAGDSRSERVVGAGNGAGCFGCHEPQKDREYVFSRYRE